MRCQADDEAQPQGQARQEGQEEVSDESDYVACTIWPVGRYAFKLGENK